MWSIPARCRNSWQLLLLAAVAADTVALLPPSPHVLVAQVSGDKDDASAKSAAAMLYETALLESGFDPDDPKVSGGCGISGARAVCVFGAGGGHVWRGPGRGRLSWALRGEGGVEGKFWDSLYGGAASESCTPCAQRGGAGG